MSNYHIRETDKEIKYVNVIFHIPIPAINNAVGVSYRTALVQYLGGAANITSIIPEVVNTQEETDMKAGIIYEMPYMLKFSSMYLTDAQRLAQIEAAFTEQRTIELNEKQVLLKYFGKNGDVV